MAKNIKNIDELKSEISKTEKQIKASDLKIESLREEKLKSENPVLIKDENDILEITLQSNTVDIKLYKEKIIKLKRDIEKNEKKLLKLREENAKLKKEKKIIKKESKGNKKKILNIKDLSQSIGIKIKEELKDDNDKEELNDEGNTKIGNIEDANKKLKEYENIFEELKEKANKIYITINNQKDKIKEYRNYLNEVQNYVSDFRERLGISINNKFLDNEHSLKLKDYNALYEKVSNILYEIDSIIFENKDKYEQNIEYNLINIKTNIFNLNKEENKNELNFKNKSTKIDEIVEEMNKIFKLIKYLMILIKLKLNLMKKIKSWMKK